MIGVVIRANAERLTGVTLGECNASDLNAVTNVEHADEMRVSVELCAHAGFEIKGRIADARGEMRHAA